MRSRSTLQLFLELLAPRPLSCAAKAMSLIIATALLSACNLFSNSPKEQLEMTRKVGTLGDVCEAARVVAKDALQHGSEQTFREATSDASLACVIAQVRGHERAADAERSAKEDTAAAEASQAAADAMAASMEAAASAQETLKTDSDIP